jgi:hypothetical protein
VCGPLAVGGQATPKNKRTGSRFRHPRKSGDQSGFGPRFRGDDVECCLNAECFNYFWASPNEPRSARHAGECFGAACPTTYNRSSLLDAQSLPPTRHAEERPVAPAFHPGWNDIGGHARLFDARTRFDLCQCTTLAGGSE